MEQVKQDRMALGILAVLGSGAVLISTVLAASALTKRGGLLTCGIAMGIWLLGALLLLRKPLFSDLPHTVAALVGLYLAVLLRLGLFNNISPDYVSFLSQWLRTIGNRTIREALVTPIGDYNMPYLYLLMVVSRLPLHGLYGIKLWSVLADVLLALAVGRLCRLVTRRPGVILAAFLATLAAPTAFLNSAYWAQCDGIYAMLGLWGLYYGLKKRPILSVVMFALSFAFKLQAVFLLPVILFFLVGGQLKLRHLPVFPAAFFVVMLPALLAGRSFSDTFNIYLNQTVAYPYLSLNATSFWSMVPNSAYDSLGPTPVLLAGTVVLGLLYVFLLRRRCGDTRQLLSVALLLAFAIPWLLPKMHERYFYVAEVLSIVYAAIYPKRFPVTVTLLTGGFFSYCTYFFGAMPFFSPAMVAGIYGLLLIYLVYALLRDTAQGSSAKIKEEFPNVES